MLQVKRDSEDEHLSDSDHGHGDSGNGSHDRIVRRRSSKACDQCRKAKCKCERTAGPNEPCSSCRALNLDCTFLGPSKKRGPAKGYLSDLELRLHQLEAIVGTLLSSQDARAQSIIADLEQDPLAQQVLTRVDHSPLGRKGRNPQSHGHYLEGSGTRGGRVGKRMTGEMTSSSQEWQDHLLKLLQGSRTPGSATNPSGYLPGDSMHRGSTNTHLPPGPPHSAHPSTNLYPSGHQRGPSFPPNHSHPSLQQHRSHPSLHSTYMTQGSAPQPNSRINVPLSTSSIPYGNQEITLESPRQRRRIEAPLINSVRKLRHTGSSHSIESGQLSEHRLSKASSSQHLRGLQDQGRDNVSPVSNEHFYETSDSEDLTESMGQLSIDERSMVRYHGAASGLHLLGPNERVDRRHEDGLWRFPPARVWPQVAFVEPRLRIRLEDYGVTMPSRERQRLLLQLYFQYVNPVAPLMDEDSFMVAWSQSSEDLDNPDGGHYTAAFALERVPVALLLVMFAITERYLDDTVPLPKDGTMWSAGEGYLHAAKHMFTANPFAASRPSTCLAYLLIVFREIGIGATSQAFLFLGVALRMAQDLGLHRDPDRIGPPGATLFSPLEKELRKRTWAVCLLLDRYVSSYLGRPCMISERDYDTPLPTESEKESKAIWEPHGARWMHEPSFKPSLVYTPTLSRSIPSLAAATSCTSILGQILEAIYSVKPAPSRHHEAAKFEQMLDKWYLDLCPELKVDTLAKSHNRVPPPHVITLNMLYWNTVLLLHRPFIRKKGPQSRATPESAQSHTDSENGSIIRSRAFDLCNAAAAHISRLGVLFMESFDIRRSAPFTYYVFSAGITHIVALASNENDIQAALHLQQSMDVLKAMSVVWASASRAWDLLHGCRLSLRGVPTHVPGPMKNKRSAAEAFAGDFALLAQHQQQQQQQPQQQQQQPNYRMEEMHQLVLDGIHQQRTNDLSPTPGTIYQPNLGIPSSFFSNTWSTEPQSTISPFSSQATISARSMQPSPQSRNAPQHNMSYQQQMPGNNQPPVWELDPYSDPQLLSSSYYGLPIVNRSSDNVAGYPQQHVDTQRNPSEAAAGYGSHFRVYEQMQ